MIKNFSLIRLTSIILLVILFPLVQNQWLNLYLFDINNFSIYKGLYYLSGIFFPILICINSFNKFTFYKFNNNKRKNYEIIGKTLFIIALLLLITFSITISNYIFINIDFIFKILINNNYTFQSDLDKQILFTLIISILLIFKRSRIFMKKFILFNFFISSTFIWYLQLNNILENDKLLINSYLNVENMNFINIFFLLTIEILYYLWSYISYSTNLSDWIVPMPYKTDTKSILNIIFFYLLIIVYYSILE